MKTLLDLLPVSPNAMLKTSEEKVKFLNMYVYFVKLSIESFETFLTGDLQKFDAHVGDTACQIRAYRVYKLYHFSSTRERLPSVIVTFQKMLDALEDIIMEFSKLKQKSYISHKDFLDVLKIEMSLDEDLAFLLVAFFLTKYSRVDEKKLFGRIDYERLYHNKNIASKGFLDRLIIYFQRFLSADSYNFLQSIVLENPDLYKASSLIGNTVLHDDLERIVVPAFVSSYIIFTDLLSASGVNICLQCTSAARLS